MANSDVHIFPNILLTIGIKRYFISKIEGREQVGKLKGIIVSSNWGQYKKRKDMCVVAETNKFTK